MAAEGEGEERRAKRDDWNTKPMPEQCTVIEINTRYSSEAMNSIRKGVVPEEMEDKWFMYYEDDEDQLYMHRSWTGFCVFIVKFQVEENGSGTAVSFTANRNSDQYKSTNDEGDTSTMTDVLRWILYAHPS